MGTSTRYRDDPTSAGQLPGTPSPPLATATPAKPLPPNAELIAAIHDVQVSLNLVQERIADLVAILKQRGSG